MHIVSAEGSERATNDSGKIITYDGCTHVAWQDVTREGYFNRMRTFEHATRLWGEPVILDTGVDNHARAVLAIDTDGVLHAILGGHGTPVRWCHALAPNDVSEWTEPIPLGVGTYPVFLCGPDGTLYLTLRGNGKKRHERGVDLYRRRPGGEWSQRRIVALCEEYGQAYAAYHMSSEMKLVFAPKPFISRLRATSVLRRKPEGWRYICYAEGFQSPTMYFQSLIENAVPDDYTDFYRDVTGKEGF